MINWTLWQNPPAFYWPGYMWIWNDKLTNEQIKSQIQEMAKCGAMTPMVVPEPKSFRPKTMPTRLEPEYLSQNYLQLYREMVEAAAQAKMNVWLYDEGGWPSGSVCGELVKRYPQLASQRLVRKNIWVWKGKTIQVPRRRDDNGLVSQKIVDKPQASSINIYSHTTPPEVGGKVLWIENLMPDKQHPSSPLKEIPLVDIRTAIAQTPKIVQIESANPFIRVCRRKLDKGNLYFLTNEALTPQECVITFPEHLPGVQIDPETALCHTFLNMKQTASGWQIVLQFNFGESMIVYFSEEAIPVVPKMAMINSRSPLITLDQGWHVQLIRSFQIQQHGIDIHDFPSDSSSSPMSLGDWRTWAGDNYSGVVEYQTLMECSSEVVAQGGILDLGTVNYSCEVTLNGQSLGQRIWAPFSFNIKNLLRPGENQLKIRVTNTLANQYLTINWKKMWSKKKLGPYHPKALLFEVDSLPSGLFGPVRIFR